MDPCIYCGDKQGNCQCLVDLAKSNADELGDVNPAFIAWAQEQGVSLEDKGDWLEWWRCWVDGYHHAVNDVKNIIP